MKKVYHNDHHFYPPQYYSDIGLIQVGRLFCDADNIIYEHVHLNWFELTIVTSGKGSVGTGGIMVPVKSGDIFLSFPADKHSIYPDRDDPLRFDYLSFYSSNPEYLAQLENVMQICREPESRVFTDELISSLVSGALSEFGKEPLLYSAQLLDHTLHLILIYLLRDLTQNTHVRNAADIKQADILCYQLMNYIDTHIFTMKDLKELSAVTNYNYSYLSRLFRHTTGRTLTEYYQNSRLKTARSLLKEGKMKVGEIAGILNYASIYTFSKAYKNRYDESPVRTKKLESGRGEADQ